MYCTLPYMIKIRLISVENALSYFADKTFRVIC